MPLASKDHGQAGDTDSRMQGYPAEIDKFVAEEHGLRSWLSVQAFTRFRNGRGKTSVLFAHPRVYRSSVVAHLYKETTILGYGLERRLEPVSFASALFDYLRGFPRLAV